MTTTKTSRLFSMFLILTLVATLFEQAKAADEEAPQTFQTWCAGCHGAKTPFSMYQGPGSGTLMLQKLYGGSKPAVLQERTDLNPELIKITVRHGRAFMPFFRKTEITDAQLDEVVKYLTRNNK